MNLPSRKTHRKSRRGCSTCKMRRVKCDEGTPSCANCLRRHLQCQYRPSQSTEMPTHRLENVISPGSVPAAGFQVTDEPQHSLFNLRDMEIFHFYVTRSYHTLHFETKIDHSLWQDHVPGVAFRHPVLMHALLCYSASHLKHINPDSTDYDQSIVVHKHHALSLLRAELDSWDSPTPPMNDAAFGTGVILAVQSLGTFKSNSASYPTDLDWIPLMIGFRALVDTWQNVQGSSIFFPLLSAYEHPKETTKEDEDACLRKFSLEKIPGQLPPSYSRHISKLAVQLAPYFPDDHYSNPPPTCSPYPGPDIPWTRTLRQLLAWFATLPESFVPRAKEGDPAILLVLWWVFTFLRELHAQQSPAREPTWWIERVATEGVEDMKRAVQN